MQKQTQLERLLTILESVFGESKSGLSDRTQVQFNCPKCSEDEGLSSGDGKYNLELNVSRGKYKCWKCEHTNNMHGSIIKLLKQHGGYEVAMLYKEEITNIKKSKEYEFGYLENEIFIEDDEEDKIKYPDKTFDFIFDGNKKEAKALEYIIKRGYSEQLIKKYSFKYTNYETKDKSFANRIIIPSFDKYGILNYYTGRSYNEKSFRKYYNCENSEKKSIMFNEHFINWDGDVVLVEGPLDHTSVPNSIPLMGKVLTQDSYVFETIIKKAKQNLIIFLDDDAKEDSKKICDLLSRHGLCERVKFIDTKELLKKIITQKKLGLEKLDPGKLYELYGYKGISWALKNRKNFECI